MEYKGHKEFFDTVGDCFLRPEIFSCTWSVTVEETYQHFKTRMLDELHEKQEPPELFPGTKEDLDNLGVDGC